jgi:hypothetical protein
MGIDYTSFEPGDYVRYSGPFDNPQGIGIVISVQNRIPIKYQPVDMNAVVIVNFSGSVYTFFDPSPSHLKITRPTTAEKVYMSLRGFNLTPENPSSNIADRPFSDLTLVDIRARIRFEA